MLKIAIVVCLAVLVSAEAEADAWYGPYSNWNMMNGNNWNMYGNNWNMYGNNWNRPGMQEGYRFNYGKRSADAEPEAEAEAEAWNGPYSNWNMNNNWMSYGMYGNNNMYNNMYNNMNYMNRPSYTQYRTFYHKRSADAEPEAEAFYGPYSYSSFGHNWPMNYNMNYNYMSYMNRPYNQFSSYRYHF